MIQALRFVLFLLPLFAFIGSANPSPTVLEKTDLVQNFKERIGLQLYSLREQFARDVPKTLDQVRNFGIKYVETHSTYGLTPEKFRAELDSRGLRRSVAISPMSGAATISKELLARHRSWASNMSAAHGFRIKIPLTKRPVAKRSRSSIGLVRRSPNT